MTVTNSKGMVLDITESYQLVPGDSEDLCGPWSVSSLRLAGLPGKGPRGSKYDIQNWTFNEVDKYMPEGHIKWPGSEISDMYNFLRDSLDPVSKKRNLHWQDINPSLENIRIAVKCGYPVLITVNEQNIKEKRTGARPPYPWDINANHIFPVVGIDKEGDFICADELNNRFQGYWPIIYLASLLKPSWASVVQVVGPDEKRPWLAPIPNDNPSSWNKTFQGQLFNMPNINKFQLQQNIDLWNSTQLLLESPIDVNADNVGKEWLNKYMLKYPIGAPLSRFNSHDWNGQPIIITLFTNGQCQDTQGKLRWWYNGTEVSF